MSYSQGTLAERGIIDLSNVDFSETKEVKLNGQWEYFHLQFLHEDQIVEPQLVEVPKLLNKQGFKAFSYGSYRLKIKHSSANQLGLEIPDIYTAYKVFINGVPVIEKGEVGRDKETSDSYILLNTIPINDESRELELVIQISNFTHHKYGINDPVVIGEYAYLKEKHSTAKSIDIFLTGCLVMGGFFFIGLYYYGRHEVAALYFALFCLCYSYRIIGWEHYALHSLFPSYPWFISVRVEYIAFYMSGFLFARYVRYLFPKDTPVLYAKAVEIISLVWVALTLVLPVRLFTQINLPYLAVILLGLVIVVITYTRAIIRKRDGAKHSLYSIAGIAVVFVLKTLAYLKYIEEPVVITITGQLVFFFFQGMIFSEMFASSWKLAKSNAEQAAQAKTEFLSIMSHEIRTPLNAVIGTTYHLIDENPREDQKSDLKDLKISAENLLSLINNILDFNRIDAGKIELDERDILFRDFIDDIVNSHKWLAKKKDITIRYSIDEKIPEVLIMDKTRIIQVLTNLIGNAIKFTEEGSVIIDVSHLPNEEEAISTVKFEVKDTGIGIAEDKHEQIFNAFEQANTSISRKYGGTGLGLSITRKILNLMGSDLEFESTEHVGSNFHFTIDLKIGSTSGILNLQPGEFDLSGVHVLLAEDNDMNALIATRLLKKWNATVDLAKNGLSAVEQNDQKNYDIILMDIQMPEMDGYTASQLIREHGSEVPIIALTASALFDTKEKLRESGINDLVTKPFEPANLYAVMLQHLKAKNVF